MQWNKWNKTQNLRGSSTVSVTGVRPRGSSGAFIIIWNNRSTKITLFNLPLIFLFFLSSSSFLSLSLLSSSSVKSHTSSSLLQIYKQKKALFTLQIFHKWIVKILCINSNKLFMWTIHIIFTTLPLGWPQVFDWLVKILICFECSPWWVSPPAFKSFRLIVDRSALVS